MPKQLPLSLTADTTGACRLTIGTGSGYKGLTIL